jgi:SAM-dependent methyltransferase
MIRDAYRRIVPLRTRISVRTFLREAPIRLRDLTPDLLGATRESCPLPPARLRSRVGTDSSRAQFVSVGRLTADIVRQLFASHRDEAARYGTWLDFGCGSGRIARQLVATDPVESLIGIDIDRDAIAWCAGHLPGRFLTIDPEPPTQLDTGSVDVAYCISVFTHLDETRQLRWLEEVHRVLRTGGLFIVSTHPPAVTYNRPDLTKADHQHLARHGFLFARGTGAFNDDSAFHTEDYLRREWSRWFELLELRAGALGSVQDLAIWRKREQNMGAMKDD